MKLFQPKSTCMYGYDVHVTNPRGWPSVEYPNAGGYCYHDFIEIEFFVEGAGIHYQNGIPWRVRSGYIYLLMPGDYHYYALDESVYYHFYNIKVDAALPASSIMESLSAYPRPYAVYLEGEEYETVLREVRYLHDYWHDRYDRGKSPVDAMTRNITERIILLLLRNLKQPERTVFASVPQEIRSIVEYVDRHYREAITSDDMARLTGLSPHYFSDYFKKHTGCAFCDYVNQVRLFRAKALLETTDLSVKEIADAAGFHSQAYFSRMFARQFSVSPREYRMGAYKI
ncbi:MAG: helix-turn-helix transcriptional regulator [Clostridia bacterium]|nr:helix-turn-helix transcriptional regulator [Clostridia bacterium]